MSKTFTTIAELPIENGVGTVGYEVLDGDGMMINARTTAGVARIAHVAGRAVYVTRVTVEDGDSPATVVWDDAAGNAVERLVGDFAPISSDGDVVTDATLPIADGAGVAGLAVYDFDGTLLAARTASGVVQNFAGTGYGIYQKSVALGVLDDVVILWDDDDDNFAFDRAATRATTEPDDEPNPTKTIRFCVVKNGELFQPATAPVLLSPSGLYGVVTIDGEHVVLPPSSAFSNSNGLYSRSFTAYDSGGALAYRYYVSVLGKFIPANTEQNHSSMLAVGRYTDSWRVMRQFGPDNVRKWLELPGGDQDEPIDFALRAWQFIDDAEKQIDAGVGRPYYDSTSFVTSVPSVVAQLATTLAAVLMYEARGVVDFNSDSGKPYHRLQWHRESVEKTLKAIRTGTMKLGDAVGLEISTTPVAFVSDSVRKIDDLGQLSSSGLLD